MNVTRSPFENDGNAATPRPLLIEYDTRAGWAQCGLVGDIYYRAMSAWMASRQTVGKVYDIYMNGVRYEAALDQFLMLSLLSPVTMESRQNRDGAMLYKSLLTREIDYLAGRLNAAQTAEPKDESTEPWPPVVPKPLMLPSQIVADVALGFREKTVA